MHPSLVQTLASIPVARLRGVTAVHDGRAALEEIDLEIPAGRMTLLIGSNGSGKSTLLGVLAGTHPVARGRIDRRTGTSIAFVVQRSAVSDRLPLTVRETVAMGRWRSRGSIRPLRKADHAIVDDCLEALGITALAPRSLAGLSSGQRQRAFVAQGLAQQADLLLLDEPTAGADATAQALIHRAIDIELGRGATVVQATHDPGLHERAALVVHLVDGRRSTG